MATTWATATRRRRSATPSASSPGGASRSSASASRSPPGSRATAPRCGRPSRGSSSPTRASIQRAPRPHWRPARPTRSRSASSSSRTPTSPSGFAPARRSPSGTPTPSTPLDPGGTSTIRRCWLRADHRSVREEHRASRPCDGLRRWNANDPGRSHLTGCETAVRSWRPIRRHAPCSPGWQGVVASRAAASPGKGANMKRKLLSPAALLLLAAGACRSGSDDVVTIPGRCAPTVTTAQTRLTIPNTGLTLSPLGRLTTVGNLPLGGALTPDGKQYWAVDSGYGLDDVQIVDLASGRVIQVLPLPGAYGGMVFSADGLTAYVSGERVGVGAVAPPGLLGVQGDVIHVFKRESATGLATEQPPIVLPASTGGSGRVNGLAPNPAGPAWPVGLALSPDGKTLVAALNMADAAAVISLPSGTGHLVATGAYPYGAAIERNGRFAYISNELDGTLTRIDLADDSTSTLGGLGGGAGDYNAHPQSLLADPHADRLYVTATNRDAVVVVDTTDDSIVRWISLARAEGPGAAPVALALAPDGSTLYVADAGENAIVAIALTARPGSAPYSVLG